MAINLFKILSDCCLSNEPIPDPSTTGKNCTNQRKLSYKFIIKDVCEDFDQTQTFLYFLSCLGGFSPANFLSNLPPLAVEVAAIPATFCSSSLLTFLGGACVPVIGNEVAAS